MPVYDRARYLRASMDSVIAQSFEDFEFLVIDDGSSDESIAIVESYRDPRIRLVAQAENRGIPRTRNHGLDLARGEFLAHADSDDILLPTRLARQVAYLDSHPEVAAVGCWMSRIDEQGRWRRGVLLRPTQPREIRGRILFATCFKNPTMVARTSILRDYRFREHLAICSDIDLWARISAKHALANLPLLLMAYRSGGSSHQESAPQLQMRELIARDQLAELGASFEASDVRNHVRLRNLSRAEPDSEFRYWAQDWLERLVALNREGGFYPEPEFSRAAAERWLLLQLRLCARGVWPSARGWPKSLARIAGGLRGYTERARAHLVGLSRDPAKH